MHAAVRSRAGHRQALEQLGRYVNAAGQIALNGKTP